MNLLFIMTGSVALKKCKDILNVLKNEKVIVDCILTKNAKKMIDIKKIKKNILGKVYFDYLDMKKGMLHINLTRKSDLIVVCPATANIIAKFSHGYADDLASTSLIASNKQILFIPAMNVEMWNNKINKKNIISLKKQGVEFIGPDYGKLSCGELGTGRLKDKDIIIKIILDYLRKSKKLNNKRCLVTAGPTVEKIDPVRYISNYSSGIQGYEIAKQLLLNGAKVYLISGPTNIDPPYNVNFIKVNSAKEMNEEVLKKTKIDIAIFTAAVSDIKIKGQKSNKIKKENLKKLILKKNPDIVKNFSIKNKKRKKTIIGFSAETDNHIKNARKKLFDKKCDLIVLNSINSNNNVFGSEYNKVSFITKNKIKKFPKMTKIDVAKKLINQIIDNINEN